MGATMMPGAPVAEATFAELAPRIAKLVENGHRPGLGTILVGGESASVGYIRIKQDKAAELDFNVPIDRGEVVGLDAAEGLGSNGHGSNGHAPVGEYLRYEITPSGISPADLIAGIREFNDDAAVDGMLVQHPTPPQIDYEAALLEIDPDKDVDGLHPVNMGRLALMMPGPVPCTPAGIEALLAYYEVQVAGNEVCILGRGTTLGRPLALLLSQKRPTANAAVTVVHTGVADWPEYTRRAEIVVAAAGVPGILKPEHITPGATVVGGGVRYEGRKLLPDVDERCNEVAGRITPRVGGVGPTTIAMLFRNAVDAAERRSSR